MEPPLCCCFIWCAAANVQVNVPCDGCTLTPGYWKTHEGTWGPTGYAPGDSFCEVFMPVDEALHDPGRFHVDEDRQVIRRVGSFQNADDPHLERIDTGDVEDALRRRDHVVAGPGAERLRRAGAEHALAQHGEIPAHRYFQAAEVEVIERRPDDRMTPRPEAHVHRDRCPEA